MIRKERNATDSHNHGTLSKADNFEQQLITLLKKIQPRVVKLEPQNEENDSYILGAQLNQLDPFSNGEETSFDRVRGKFS